MKQERNAKKALWVIGVIIAVGLIGFTGYWWYLTQQNTESIQASTTSSSGTTVSIDSDDEDIDWDSLPTTEIALSGQTAAITAAGTYILSGTGTGGVTVNTDGNVRIVLNGATISSSDTAGIYVENAENVVLQVASETENTVSDASTRADTEIDGAIFSKDNLIINGEGSLTVTANYADGIVSKDDLKILSGTYIITSVDDAIRGTDSVTILGGTINIDAQGDGIKSTNDTDLGEGNTVILGGIITISSGDDAIKAEQTLTISGGTIDITSSVEGIEAPVIVIDGGDISLYASDDGMNASASAIVTTGLSITFNSGSVMITVGSGDTDAVDSNGDIYVNGGNITITAPTSSFDFDGTGEINGGTVIVNGTQITTMPTQMVGGGMGDPTGR